LRERILIDGMPVHILDTAGLRDTNDRVEAEGIKRARAEIHKADHVLYVVDVHDHDPHQLQNSLSQLPSDIGITVLLNKCDLIDATHTIHSLEIKYPKLYVSATYGTGLDTLREHLKNVAGFVNSESGIFLARRRHLDALHRTGEHIQQAQTNLLKQHAGELCAEELRLAQQQLAEITGEFTSDDLLGRIFSSFCIGK